MATKVVSSEEDFVSLSFGELFLFRGILFEKKECPCTCGRPYAVEYMTGKQNSALTILMRAKTLNRPTGLFAELISLQALGNMKDACNLALSVELAESLTASRSGKFDCTYDLLAAAEKYVLN